MYTNFLWFCTQIEWHLFLGWVICGFYYVVHNIIVFLLQHKESDFNSVQARIISTRLTIKKGLLAHEDIVKGAYNILVQLLWIICTNMGNYFICLLTDCIYTKTVQNDFKLLVKFYIYTIIWCGRRGGGWGGVQDRGGDSSAKVKSLH